MKSPSVLKSLGKLGLLVGTMLSTTTLALAQTTPPPPADAQEEPTEILVLGKNIPDPQRDTSEVVSVLTAADLERTGDDNAAAALTRLSGLSVVGGKFVYVRGLGDRYSSAQLNGSPLPSPEPLRRQVPLDLFPSNILSGALVQKTFSANNPAEFGGGIINLETVKSPDKAFLTLKVGTGLNSVSTGRDGLTYRGSRNDWTGLGGSIRNLPGAVQSAINSGRRINGANFQPSQLETIGESFVNSPLTVIQSQVQAPDLKLEASGGTKFDLGFADLGLVGVFGYSSQQRNLVNVCRQIAGGGAGGVGEDFCPRDGELDRLGDPFGFRITTWDVVTNGFVSASLSRDENTVTATALIIRSSEKRAQIGAGVNDNTPGDSFLHREQTSFYERQLLDFQLNGDHKINAWNVKWRVSAAESRRDSPYERSITYTETPAEPIIYQESNGGNLTRFSYLNDQIFSGGLDVAYTIPLSPYRDAVLSAGFDYSKTDRDYSLRDFTFAQQSGNPALLPDLTNRPDFLFQPDAIRPDGFQIAETTRADDSYDGFLGVKAAYFSSDVEIIPLVHVAAGFRYEDASERVRTLNTFNEATFRPVGLNNNYFLPAATVTWNFAENLLARAGYSKTIARPQFRELAFSPYTDPETDRRYRGNPFLQDSRFNNYDARLEYYFGSTQFATLAGFYKRISNPIEEVIVPTSGFTETRFINAPSARLFGFEGEYRTKFDLPWDFSLLPDAKWVFSVNYTYTNSRVNAGDELVNDPARQPDATQLAPARNFIQDGTRLQGTPTHIVNTQYGYERDGQQSTIILGWVSERIARRGLSGVPTTIERPGVILDFVHKQDISVYGRKLTFGLEARNLLNTEHQEFQTSSVARTEANTYRYGRSLSASITANF